MKLKLKEEKKYRKKAIKRLARRIQEREYHLKRYRQIGFIDVSNVCLSLIEQDKLKIKEHLQRIEEIQQIFTNYLNNN